jgi:hypothetical protein
MTAFRCSVVFEVGFVRLVGPERLSFYLANSAEWQKVKCNETISVASIARNSSKNVLPLCMFQISMSQK